MADMGGGNLEEVGGTALGDIVFVMLCRRSTWPAWLLRRFLQWSKANRRTRTRKRALDKLSPKVIDQPSDALAFSDLSLKLFDAKALAAWSMMLVEEAETEGYLNESKKEPRALTDDRDKLKKDLVNSKANVAEFSKKYNHANQANELTAKALEEANNLKKGLVYKIARLENTLDFLKAECSELKEKNMFWSKALRQL
ncbi:Uncharacterized protein Fot_06380 [Forsythia ovata]|uniref:Uncharacterized protein n=1 Tax=Forsythia ovata TaxID=205694 RepID=A0ABD1WSS9_9LAMI